MLEVLGGLAWRGAPDGIGFALALPPPVAECGRCVLLVEGWAPETVAAANARWGEAPATPERPFLSLRGAVAACVLDRPSGPAATALGAAPIHLRAPLPPEACRMLALRLRAPVAAQAGAAGPHSVSAALLPRCLGLPTAPASADAGEAALPARVAEDLASGRLAEALAECATALLAGSGDRGGAAPVRVAARLVLDHLARHPLARDPALGAFLGALLDA